MKQQKSIEFAKYTKTTRRASFWQTCVRDCDLPTLPLGQTHQ